MIIMIMINITNIIILMIIIECTSHAHTPAPCRVLGRRGMPDI